MAEPQFQDRPSPPACRLIRPTEAYEGKQGLSYFAGIAADTVGARAICMHLVTVPPGARSQAHVHDQHETAIYVLSGEVETWFGERLEQRVTARAGDMLYIPAGVPHVSVNRCEQPAAAVIARTDPNEQESVSLRPELDPLLPP